MKPYISYALAYMYAAWAEKRPGLVGKVELSFCDVPKEISRDLVKKDKLAKSNYIQKRRGPGG